MDTQYAQALPQEKERAEDPERELGHEKPTAVQQ